MDTCDMMFSAGHVLSEQVARQVFDALPEQGVVVAIVGHDGTRWQSQPEELSRLGVDEAVLAELRARVDDGAEPAVVRLGDASVTMAQLTTEHTNCGYAIVAVSRSLAKPAVADIALLEAFLSQVSLVARLIERNSLLADTQIGCLREPGASASSLN
ncbi:MAG: hypothetical protein A2Y77_00395 [Planctomycetes bacterium RBG_13_62_9]|nr:MAG: hypothetical protein A2Y77_00395 [Planctomycetes bacterium RBG_13_62_9]